MPWKWQRRWIRELSTVISWWRCWLSKTSSVFTWELSSGSTKSSDPSLRSVRLIVMIRKLTLSWPVFRKSSWRTWLSICFTWEIVLIDCTLLTSTTRTISSGNPNSVSLGLTKTPRTHYSLKKALSSLVVAGLNSWVPSTLAQIRECPWRHKLTVTLFSCHLLSGRNLVSCSSAMVRIRMLVMCLRRWLISAIWLIRVSFVTKTCRYLN